jgi:hypothetical protein
VIRNVIWGDTIALWREAALQAPDDPLPHTVLGESWIRADAIRKPPRNTAALDETRRPARVLKLARLATLRN